MEKSLEIKSESMIQVESNRAIAEVQAVMMLAKKYPRDEQKALDKILVSCQRISLAETSMYTYSRGGTEITGPSIRLAESIAHNWGNIQYGIVELAQREGESTVEAFAWDIENNVRQTKTFQVKHIRATKKGHIKLEEPRDIYELIANNGARRMRACILGLIPGDIIDHALDQCELTLKSKADITPEGIKKMIDKFATLEISKEQIEKRIQRHIDSITSAQLVALRKIYNSIKDGMSTPSDWFETIIPKPNEQIQNPASKYIPNTIDKISSLEGVTNEKTWISYSIFIKGIEYRTFDAAIHEIAQNLYDSKGDFDFTYEEKGKHKNIITIDPIVIPAAAEPQTEDQENQDFIKQL